jgi:hypothetical protein
VVRVPGCRLRGSGFDSLQCYVFRETLDLESGPLSFVRITEERVEYKAEALV